MLNIIPKPNNYKLLEGYITLKKEITINKIELANNAILLLSNFFDLVISDNPIVNFVIDESKIVDGSYSLIINENITIKANSSRGFLYAIESLRQLLPSVIETKNFNEVTINKVEIDDYPRYDYRGYMIDVARNFLDKEIIKRKLDQMAMFKLNKLHFHISDDQGFRIDLPNYPKLKEISSTRNISKIKGRVAKSKYDVYDYSTKSGIFSIQDINEIVDYASKLDIDIIPEIDSPGHLTSIFAAYNEFSCFNKKLVIKGEPGIYKDILCIGNDKAVDFIFNLILDILKLFPSKMVHIGGDEAPLDNIKKCPKCLAKAKELGFKNILDLKLDYSNKLAKKLIDLGYEVTGWNEIANANYPKEATLQIWSPLNNKLARNYVNKGYKAIVSSFSKMYLDYAYGMFPLKKSYKFNPSSIFNKNGANNVLGVESPCWAEWIDNEHRLNWQTYPKLLATCETAWTLNKFKDYNDFISRVDIINERFELMNINHALKKCYNSKQKYTILDLYIRHNTPSNIEYEKYNTK